jgi:hypothetical protein
MAPGVLDVPNGSAAPLMEGRVDAPIMKFACSCLQSRNGVARCPRCHWAWTRSLTRAAYSQHEEADTGQARLMDAACQCGMRGRRTSSIPSLCHHQAPDPDRPSASAPMLLLPCSKTVDLQAYCWLDT